jgi:ABC-2 type transport system ATP-binding protein
MALVHDPRVLFLDEPTTGLDPEARADMWDQIAALAAEQDKTVLLTTHYLEEADQLAAQVAIVDRGKVVTEGTPEELKSELRGDAVYVDLEVSTVRVARPSLDDVYLRYAGRTFQEAESEQDSQANEGEAKR